MLKTIAKAFEFNEKSISKKKLRLILILMILSTPTWPLLTMNYYGMFKGSGFGGAVSIAIYIGMISMLCFICTRFVNRFYFPDKYLDEWEIKIKHKSMTFAFMVMVWIAAPIFIFLAMFQQVSINLSGEAVGLWAMGGLLALLYLQTFHALWQVRPIDEELPA